MVSDFQHTTYNPIPLIGILVLEIITIMITFDTKLHARHLSRGPARPNQ